MTSKRIHMAPALSPHLSPLQQATSRKGGHPPVPALCAVTGGTGFVGARLVEMLVERGAKKVRVLDVVPPPETRVPALPLDPTRMPSMPNPRRSSAHRSAKK